MIRALATLLSLYSALSLAQDWTQIAQITDFFNPLTKAKNQQMSLRIGAFCDKLDSVYKGFLWGQSPCHELSWRFDILSEGGEPLIYWEFSQFNQEPEDDSSETTLILSGVHPNEITPIHLAFRFALELKKDPSIYAGRRVIIAPLVNPDGFFSKPITRTNLHGVDLNRNFATQDWWAKAHRWWETKRNNDNRYFPGIAPNTEQGTRFQASLVGKFQPDKVLSLHAPLGLLDYDGPGDEKHPELLSEQEVRAMKLAKAISQSTRDYQVKDFQFYPGSLGNFLGNEREIPTITVELSSTNPRHVAKFWRQFYPGLKAGIQYDFKRSVWTIVTENK